MRQAFEEAMGLKEFKPATTPLEALIDKVTDYPNSAWAQYVTGFLGWVTITHWGLEEAPFAFQKDFAEKAKKGLAFYPKKG
jgi:hypothetical protein